MNWDGILSGILLVVVVLALGFAGDIERVYEQELTVASK